MAGIFRKSKELKDMLEKQMALNSKIGDKLKITERSLSEYQKFFDFIDEKVEKMAGNYTELRNTKTTNISHIFWKVSWKKSRNIGTTIIYMHIQV